VDFTAELSQKTTDPYSPKPGAVSPAPCNRADSLIAPDSFVYTFVYRFYRSIAAKGMARSRENWRLIGLEILHSCRIVG